MKQTKLSVNINKIATLRNSRGGKMPDVMEAAKRIQEFGADGITVHPRPDERHIRYQDVLDLKGVVHTEFNIEGYPTDRFMHLVLDIAPTQVTLVPDSPDVLTSNAGWDTVRNAAFLRKAVDTLKAEGIRVSLFIGADQRMIKAAKDTGADRVELYTESYAAQYGLNREEAISPFVNAAKVADDIGLGINAGHDLSLANLHFFKQQIPELAEVSIGHALMSDALYLGMSNTVRMYKNLLG